MCKYCEDVSAELTAKGESVTIFEPVTEYNKKGRNQAAIVLTKAPKRCGWAINIGGDATVKISHCPWCGRRLENGN